MLIHMVELGIVCWGKQRPQQVFVRQHMTMDESPSYHFLKGADSLCYTNYGQTAPTA